MYSIVIPPMPGGLIDIFHVYLIHLIILFEFISFEEASPLRASTDQGSHTTLGQTARHFIDWLGYMIHHNSRDTDPMSTPDTGRPIPWYQKGMNRLKSQVAQPCVDGHTYVSGMNGVS